MPPAPGGGIGVAIVGYGAIAALHARVLSELGCRVIAVCGPNPIARRTFALEHRIPVETESLTHALKCPGVEAAVIASPNDFHSTHARAALDEDLHVLVEIPLAMSLGEGEALLDEADRRGLRLGVCQTLRYWETMQRARQAADGLEILAIVARALMRRHANVGWTGRQRTWTDDLLWHPGMHVFDAVVGLLGSPVSSVMSVAGTSAPSGRPMDYGVILRAESGAIASVTLSYNSHVSASDYLVIGRDDTLHIEGGTVRLSSGLLYEGPSSSELQHEAMRRQDREFLDYVRTGRGGDVAAGSVLPTMRIVQAVHDGAVSGTR